MKISKRQLKKIIKEEYTKILTEMSQPGLPPLPSDSDIRKLRKILDLARGGYKIYNKTTGKNVYVGIGNRKGLHSYAYTLAAEKWVRGEKSFFKKLKKLQVGDVLIEKGSHLWSPDEAYEATWTQGLYDLFQMVSHPTDLYAMPLGISR